MDGIWNNLCCENSDSITNFIIIKYQEGQKKITKQDNVNQNKERKKEEEEGKEEESSPIFFYLIALKWKQWKERKITGNLKIVLRKIIHFSSNKIKWKKKCKNK